MLCEDEAFLVSGEVSRRYLVGYSSTDGYLIITKKDARFFIDARYFEAAQKTITVCQTELFKGFDGMKNYLGGIKNIIVESSVVTLRQFEKLKEIFAPMKVSVNGEFDLAIEKMRQQKSAEEIALLIKAQTIAEAALYETLQFIRVGMTENEVAAFLEYSMRKNGGEKLSFDTIVVSGKSGSVPHGVPGGKKIELGDFVTMDFGTVVGGYHSDMTRTVVMGRASERQKNVYFAVLDAQKKAIETVKAGVKCSDVDKAARDLLKERGFGEYFTHSTGHGVGLEIHESPAVSEKNDSLLTVGTVITVEPGIYIPGELGVRIEDFGVVTKDGFENFTKADKNLLEIMS